jgi:hypothetical protein
MLASACKIDGEEKIRSTSSHHYFHILRRQKNLLLAKTMLASTVSVARRRFPASVRSQAKRGLSTQADKPDGPIGKDGRHELWREGIYDHDNEPK